MQYILFFLIFVSMNANAQTKFEQIENFDKEYRQCLEFYNTNDSINDEEIIQVSNGTINCLLNVGYEIIDEFYHNKSEETKKALKTFIYSSIDIQYAINTNSDFGQYFYGSIRKVTAAALAVDNAKNVIRQLIDTVKYEIEDMSDEEKQIDFKKIKNLNDWDNRFNI